MIQNKCINEKLIKAQAMANKLAMLMSKSSVFEEQLNFLQSVYDCWKSGKTSLEVKVNDPPDHFPASNSKPVIPKQEFWIKAPTSTVMRVEKRDCASISPQAYLLDMLRENVNDHLPLTIASKASFSQSLSPLAVKDSNVGAQTGTFPTAPVTILGSSKVSELHHLKTGTASASSTTKPPIIFYFQPR